MKKFFLISMSIFILVSVFLAENKSQVLTGYYLGQSRPGLNPEIFAPGFISSPEHRELGGCAVSSDGKEYYFTRDVDNNWVLLVSRWEKDGWTEPKPVKFSAGYTALEPHITYDNQRIFWVWRGREDKGMYMAKRTSKGWSKPEYAGPGMMVSSTREGQLYVTDIQVEPNRIVSVSLENERFTKYTRLQGEIVRFQNETRSAHPCIAPDGSYLIFDKNGTYFYASFRTENNEWTEPIDLTKNVFNPNAGIATISPDGEYLFFGQNDDIYWVSTEVIKRLAPKH